ncbi:uncharacterized protein LOC113513011 [Galleria mellonella]|uniref:Uncharacterized protein LOC113513011 n=1 Tax=Galleria mellonella TaxID=7137 RepID=A0A6J1WND7_GALME|nr:uncharacterized protein LOC113513011 [Galleria mellonella]
MIRWRSLLAWSLIINVHICHRVIESTEDTPTELETFYNTTTLYPISNTTNVTKNELNSNNKTINTAATVWKIETAFAESKLPKTEKENVTNPVESKENLTQNDIKMVNSSKEFKPSPQLETYFDESHEIFPPRKVLESFVPMRKPASAFLSSHRDPFKSNLYNIPRDIFRQNDFPYKIENSILTKTKNNWQPSRYESSFESGNLESKPTVEVPMRVPAGGLYKSPDAFKNKPNEDGDNEDFGLDFNATGDVKENPVDIKKRVNPWRNLLRLVTAFIPVGLIISALTPNVITIENTGPGNHFPSHMYRRSDTVRDLAPISESCRRRLLCELHSEKNYESHIPYKSKQCYKLHCGDQEALSKILQWLLTHDRPKHEHHRPKMFT